MKFWLGLQDDYDVEEELLKKAKEIKTTKQYLMKKKIYIFFSIFVFFSVVVITGCKKTASSDNSNCEIVYQGDRYLKVINDLDVKVQVYLGGYGAQLNPKTCERYGVNSGTRTVEFTNMSTQIIKTVEYNVAIGETYTIEITNDFFSN